MVSSPRRPLNEENGSTPSNTPGMPPKGRRKDAATQNVPSKAPPKAEQPRPNWPVLHPLLSNADLHMHELLAGHIVTIANFWTSTLCKNYTNFLSSLPLTTTPGTPKRGDAVRVNDRFQIDDPAFAERLWSGTALKDLVLGNLEQTDGLSIPKDGRQALWGGEVVSYTS